MAPVSLCACLPVSNDYSEGSYIPLDILAVLEARGGNVHLGALVAKRLDQRLADPARGSTHHQVRLDSLVSIWTDSHGEAAALG